MPQACLLSKTNRGSDTRQGQGQTWGHQVTRPVELIAYLGQPWGLTSHGQTKALWPTLPTLVGGLRSGRQERLPWSHPQGSDLSGQEPAPLAHLPPGGGGGPDPPPERSQQGECTISSRTPSSQASAPAASRSRSPRRRPTATLYFRHQVDCRSQDRPAVTLALPQELISLHWEIRRGFDSRIPPFYRRETVALRQTWFSPGSGPTGGGASGWT